MDDQHFLHSFEVRRRANVHGEAGFVGQPRDSGVRREWDPVREDLAALRLDHMEHALLVAPEREAVADARAVR
jgi:hypothetical protein